MKPNIAQQENVVTEYFYYPQICFTHVDEYSLLLDVDYY